MLRTCLQKAIREPWGVWLMWHCIVSRNGSYTCTRNRSHYRAVSEVFPSVTQPYHGVSAAGFFVVTPPLMYVLTLSFSDGGRKHFSSMSPLPLSPTPLPFCERSVTFILAISTAGSFRRIKICVVQSSCRQTVQKISDATVVRKDTSWKLVANLKKILHILGTEAGALCLDLTSESITRTLASSGSAFRKCLQCFQTFWVHAKMN